MKKKLALIVAAALMLTAIFTSCKKGGNDPASSGSAPDSKTEGTSKKDETSKPEESSKSDDTSKPEETTEPAPTENWVLATDYDFFDKDGNEVSPVSGGDPWSLFDYWTGWDDTQIYDSHGSGFYVTTKVNASKIKVGFGNGGPNGHTNIEIYVDGELKLTCDGTEEFDGVPWYTEEIEVTPGEHTVMVKAGEPKTPDTWNGLTFNVVSYVPAE